MSEITQTNRKSTRKDFFNEVIQRKSTDTPKSEETKMQTKTSIETYIETITPETAVEYLSYNQNWRKPTQARVDCYARDMAEGNWEMNGESIKFDVNGWLVDGQNRLNACIQARCPFQTIVVRGVKTTEQVDRGQTRNFSQLLSHLGHENAARLGAMLNYLWRYERTGRFSNPSGGNKPTDNELLKILRNNSGVKDSLHKITAAQRLFSKFTLLATLHYLFAKKTNTDLADKFFDGIIRGNSLSEFDPRFHLRARLYQNNTGKAKLIGAEIAALTIKAFNAFVEERAVSTLRWRTVGDNPERFPEIVTLPSNDIGVVG